MTLHRMLMVPALALALAPFAPRAETTPLALHSVTVDLPNGDRVFPGGAAAEAINNNCIGCHSAGMVLNQPNLRRATWQEEVTKMRVVYKAPIEDADVPAIVDYLARTKGAD